MPPVKKNRHPSPAGATAGAGRVAQRNRTRKAIIEATMRLLEAGRTPSMADIASEAEVSRRTLERAGEDEASPHRMREGMAAVQPPKSPRSYAVHL